MVKKPDTCKGCPLFNGGWGFSTTDGTNKHGVLLVGEALGAEEIAPGLPFQGTAGKLLNRMISRTEDPDSGLLLSRDEFLLANVIWCRPPENVLSGAPYETAAIEKCSPYLEEVIRTRKPKCILALGNTALRWLTGQWGIDSLRGYVFDTQWGPVVGTYHPSYIGRGKFPLARVFQMDLQRALKVARGENWALEKHYTLVPSYREAYDFLEQYRLAGCPPLAFDIETPWSKIEKDTMVGDIAQEDDASYTILRISFAFRPGEAITFPWCAPFISVAAALLAEGGDKLVWNRHFDVPRLAAQGIEFGGPIIDGMDAWHFLEPSFPMGLKYCATFFCPDMHAWKLESQNRPEWYSCADSDVLLRCFNGIRERLEKAGKWGIFQKHFVDLSQVLGKMSKRGVAVDPVQRKARYEEFLEKYETIVRRVQPLVPIEIKKRKIYKKTREWLEERGKWDESRILPVSVLEWKRKPKPPKEKKPRKKKEPSTSKKGQRKKSSPAETVENPQKESTPSS